MLEIFYALAIIIIIVCWVIALLIGAGAITIILHKVPFVPTPKKKVLQIINALNLQSGQKFYDLGCGQGQFIIEAAKRGAEAFGFELSLWAYFRSLLNIIFAKSKAKIFFKNFYTADLTKADVIYCFLIGSVMPKVEKKLQTDLKPGALVASYAFPLPTWQPEKIISTNLKNKDISKLYVYRKK